MRHLFFTLQIHSLDLLDMNATQVDKYLDYAEQTLILSQRPLAYTWRRREGETRCDLKETKTLDGHFPVMQMSAISFRVLLTLPKSTLWTQIMSDRRRRAGTLSDRRRSWWKAACKRFTLTLLRGSLP